MSPFPAGEKTAAGRAGSFCLVLRWLRQQTLRGNCSFWRSYRRGEESNGYDPRSDVKLRTCRECGEVLAAW